jgi:hypothetical protein
VEFERVFRNCLEPWTEEDLEAECADCKTVSEEVSTRRFNREYGPDDYVDLCEKCYEKRTASESQEKDKATVASTGPDLNVDLSTPEKCEEVILRIQELEKTGQMDAARAKSMIQLIHNAEALLKASAGE